jgi:hypothetical protein
MNFPQESWDQKDYVSYMLRMWRDSGDEGAGSTEEGLWRASLQSPHSGRRVAFASMEELFCFLRRQASP